MRQLGLWGPVSPPTLRSLTGTLRQLNRVLSEPVAVSLTGSGLVGMPGELRAEPLYGYEVLPGNGEPMDAVAIARRLLAALRDLEPAKASAS